MTDLPRGAPVFDCLSCGACCCNPDDNRAEGFRDWVEVAPRDKIWSHPKQVRRLIVYNAQEVPHLRLDGDQRCVALRGKLGRQVACDIYEIRPRACRRVEAGSDLCRQYRQERGIDSAPAKPDRNRRRAGSVDVG